MTRPADEPGISWLPALGELPPPIRWGAPTLRVAVAPPLHVRPLETDVVRPAAPAGTPAAAAPSEPEPAVVPPVTRRRRWRRAVLTAAVVALLVAGGTSAALVAPHPARPVLTGWTAYRDPQAGFSFVYPPGWQVQQVSSGHSLSLLAGPATAPAGERTSVSIAVGATSAPLPAPSDLARATIVQLQPQLPGLALRGFGQSTLAGGPAVQVGLSDPTTSPATVVQETVGRTADGRYLVVTIIEHDPRYTPSAATLRDFVASVTS